MNFVDFVNCSGTAYVNEREYMVLGKDSRVTY